MFKKILKGLGRAIKDILPIPNDEMWERDITKIETNEEKIERVSLVISQFVSSGIALFIIIRSIFFGG